MPHDERKIQAGSSNNWISTKDPENGEFDYILSIYYISESLLKILNLDYLFNDKRFPIALKL